MVKVFARLIVISLCVVAHADESWFEGHWILDRKATLAAWTKATDARIARNLAQPEPGFEGMSAEEIRARIAWGHDQVEGIAVKSWDEGGLPEIEVESGMWALRYKGSVYGAEAYSLRPIEPGAFEVVGSSEGSKCVVRKTKTGFCKAECGTYDEPLAPHDIVYSQECFKRHGA